MPRVRLQPFATWQAAGLPGPPVKGPHPGFPEGIRLPRPSPPTHRRVDAGRGLGARMLQTLAAGNGLDLGFYNVPWSWVALIVVVVIGLLLVRTAITLVKVLIIVAIGFAIYLGLSFLFNQFV